MPKANDGIAQITGMLVQQWFLDSSKSRPWPSLAECEHAATQLEKIRRDDPLPVQIRRFEDQESQENAPFRKKGQLFLAALELRIRSLDEMHRTHLAVRAQIPELNWPVESQFADDAQELRDLKARIIKSIGHKQKRRSSSEWYPLAAEIARLAISTGEKAGKRANSLHAEGLVIKFTQVVLANVFRIDRSRQAIARAFERHPDLSHHAKKTST